MAYPSKELAAILAGEIGPDAAYVRKEADRLYLSGIEIGIIIGTGVLTSFCIGFFNGVKKGISKHAEKWGEATVDGLIAKLQSVLGDIRSAVLTNPSTSTVQMPECHRQLDEVIESPDVAKALADSDPKLTETEVIEVALYLTDVGFPKEESEERAALLVARIRREYQRG